MGFVYFCNIRIPRLPTDTISLTCQTIRRDGSYDFDDRNILVPSPYVSESLLFFSTFSPRFRAETLDSACGLIAPTDQGDPSPIIYPWRRHDTRLHGRASNPTKTQLSRSGYHRSGHGDCLQHLLARNQGQ